VPGELTALGRSVYTSGSMRRRRFTQRIMLLALALPWAPGLWSCASGNQETSPEESRARSIRDFKDQHPGGMILRGTVEDYGESEYVSGKGVYAGDLWLRVREVRWVGPKYSQVEAVASRLGSLGPLLKAALPPVVEGPKVEDSIRVMVLVVPMPLERWFVPGREVPLASRRHSSYPFCRSFGVGEGRC
jgi:hypothetical protein